MDTTYWWREYGYMVFRSRELKKNILRYKVSYETIEQYKNWIATLLESWVLITWIVCDWRRWLLWGFWEIPTQMCQFHQKQIVIRNITKRPKLDANKELLEITDALWKVRSKIRIERLNDRHRRWQLWLYEKNIQHWYVHIRTIRAYKSLKNNFQYLFVYETFSHIPNTTNSLEAVFSWLKEKLWNHRWLIQSRKQKYIERYLDH
jgi:hypothetical protein